MKNITTFYILLLLFCSCSEKERISDYPLLKVSLERQEVSIKDLFKHLEIIPLETNDSCLLVFPDKVLCTNEHYEVFDHKRNALFLFDKDGKFIRQVGKRGEGVGEYREVYDVINDSRNGNICLLSPFQEIFVYNSEGDFIKRLQLPEKSNYQAIMDYENYFVTWTLPISDEESGISLISKDSLQCVREYWKGNPNTMFLYPRAFHKYREELFFSRPFQHQVYKFSLNNIQVAYQWDFGSENYLIEDFGFSLKEKGNIQERNELMDLLERKTIPYCFVENRQTDKYYYTMIVYGFTPTGRKHLFYRKSDGKSFFFRETKEGIILNPMYFCDDFLLSIASYEDLNAYRNILNKNELDKIKNYTEEDNPFLIKCYFK